VDVILADSPAPPQPPTEHRPRTSAAATDTDDEVLTPFCRGFIIADMIFSALWLLLAMRALFVVIQLSGRYGAGAPPGRIVLQLMLMFGLGGVGLAAGILILRHQPTGIMLGWIKVALVLTGIIQSLQIMASSSGRTIFYGGNTLWVVARVGLGICYAIAVIQATLLLFRDER